jgi:uncharacterized protein YuzE
MNTLNRIGTAYMNKNFEEVVKIDGQLLMNRKDPKTKENVNVFIEASKYHFGALFELDNRNEAIEKALDNAGDISTHKPDIKIRGFRYKLYRMMQNINEREPFEWRNFGEQGMEIENSIFKDFKNIESRELRREALDYLEEIYRRWIGYWRIYMEHKHIDTRELDKEIRINDNGNVIGFSFIFFPEELEANNRRMFIQQELKDEEQTIPLRIGTIESVKQLRSNIVNKKEEIARWRDEIEKGNFRDNMRAIKRITTDHFLALKNKKPPEASDYKINLESLNQEILEQVDDDTIRSLINDPVDKEWIDALVDYITYR